MGDLDSDGIAHQAGLDRIGRRAADDSADARRRPRRRSVRPQGDRQSYFARIVAGLGWAGHRVVLPGADPGDLWLLAGERYCASLSTTGAAGAGAVDRASTDAFQRDHAQQQRLSTCDRGRSGLGRTVDCRLRDGAGVFGAGRGRASLLRVAIRSSQRATGRARTGRHVANFGCRSGVRVPQPGFARRR